MSLLYLTSDSSSLSSLLLSLTSTLSSFASSSSRILASISGIPGSGKTTLSELVRNKLNRENEKEICICISMDGYHYRREELDKFDEPKEAHKRRGAYWTFDGEKFFNLLKNIKENCNDNIYANSFDHSIKDPIVNSTCIKPNHNIIIVEGLYLNINISPWNEINKLFDIRFFLLCDLNIAANRVAKRHVESGICLNIEDALERVKSNDNINAEFILKNLIKD